MLGVLVLLLAAAPVIVMNRAALRGVIKDLPYVRNWLHRRTVNEQIQTYGPAARIRLATTFKAAGAEYPPDRIAMVAIKNDLRLQVYAAAKDRPYRFIRSYEILGASGHLGPKLRVGDMQVPEGIYDLTLEPNTPYHLALRLNYPNEFDRQHATEDKRDPGGDILIHGTTCSVGCLAMGDPASEDLFVMANDAHDKNIQVVICPVDLRISKAPEESTNDPKWLTELYQRIKLKLSDFPAPTTRTNS